MKIFLSAVLFLTFQSLSYADFNANARGTTTANFLKLGVGARAVAMGEAYSAVADDATALYWNPAGMMRIDDRSATLMHAPYLASTFYDFGGYAQRREHHAWGMGVQYFSAGSINETDENNTAIGRIRPYDMAASLGYAYQFGDQGLSLGMVGKYIKSKIIASASTAATDVGLQTRPFWDLLRLAATASNIGGKMKFEEEAESLPLLLRFGSALALSKRWLASFDVVAPKDNSPYAAFGTEYVWQSGEGLAVAGRLGYNSRTTGDIDGVTGLSFGFGLGWRNLLVDYAFLPYGGLGLTHRISLGFKWGGAENEHDVLRAQRPGASLHYPSGEHDELP